VYRNETYTTHRTAARRNYGGRHDASDGCNATTSQVTAQSHPLHAHRIVCVGDSITEGFADPNNWPYHLKQRLGGDWEVVDQGVGGAKTADMLVLIDAALALNPHFVIILGGTNDLANGEVPQATTQANIKAMCTRIESYGAVPVLCTVPPDSYHLVQRDILNAWIVKYANLNGYGLIDFYAVINDPSNPGHSNPALVMSDGLHPNAAGYTAMGNAINLAIFPGGTTASKVTITASTASPTVGQSVTFTVDLNSGSTGLSKKVTIWHSWPGGDHAADGTFDVVNGAYTFTQAFGSTGERVYHAEFAGDSTYGASSSTVTVNVQSS